MTDDINPARNLATVQNDMAEAATAAGRDPVDVQVVAVSKVHGPDRIRPVLDAGHRIFGENRIQEAEQKWPALRADYPDVTLHLIGPLQSNKVKNAVATFDVIETIDRPKIAKAIAQELKRSGKTMPCFVQVNTGDEPQKAGIAPADVDAFVALCRDDLGLDIAGLMCIPPIDEEPALHFALLSKIATRNGLVGLSMGMSADYEKAIQFGATQVRVGSAIFGARSKPLA